MPLLYMVGITSLGISFSIGFCFLPGEKEEDYTWALSCFYKLDVRLAIIVIDGDQALKNAAEKVFLYMPTLLCVWHIN